MHAINLAEVSHKVENVSHSPFGQAVVGVANSVARTLKTGAVNANLVLQAGAAYAYDFALRAPQSAVLDSVEYMDGMRARAIKAATYMGIFGGGATVIWTGLTYGVAPHINSLIH